MAIKTIQSQINFAIATETARSRVGTIVPNPIVVDNPITIACMVTDSTVIVPCWGLAGCSGHQSPRTVQTDQTNLMVVVTVTIIITVMATAVR